MEGQEELDVRKYLRLLYKRRRFVVLIVMAAVTVAAGAAILMPRSYEAASTVFIERNYLDVLIKDIAITPSIEEKAKALAAVMKSRSVLLKVIRDLDLDVNRQENDIERLVRHFQKQTQIKIEMSRSNRRDMDLFIVSYRSRDPYLARDYVNTLVRRYIEASLEVKREEAFGASRFLEDQIAYYKERIDRADSELMRLLATEDVQAMQRILALRKELNTLLMQYTRDHPSVVRVLSEIESLTGQTGAATASGGKRTGLSSAIAANQKRLKDLEMDRDANQKIYDELVETFGRSQVSSQVEAQNKAGTFRILDPAILPMEPVGPGKMKIMLLGIFAGIAGGLGLIILGDFFDSSVKGVDSLKELGVPLLGIIPNIKNAQELQKKRRIDVILYGLAGTYTAAVIAFVSWGPVQ